LKSGILRTTSRPGTCSAFFCAANAVRLISATSAREIHLPVASSSIASVYSIVAHLVGDRRDGGPDLGVHPYGHRYRGSTGQGGMHRAGSPTMTT